MWPYVMETPFKIGTYGVMMAVGFLTSSWWMNKELRRRNIDPGVGDMTIMLGIVLGVIGSKLAYMLTEAETFSFSDLISGAGLTWHGGLIMAGTGIVVYWVMKKLSVLIMLDNTAPMLASGYAFGRVGCFISGDGCYGIPCTPTDIDRLFCMPFPNGIVPTTIPVHPTPLYEALAGFVIAAILWKIRKLFKHPGILFAIYLVGTGFSRFFIEFIRRADGRPDRFLDLRDAHWIALAQVALGVAMVIWAMLRTIPKGHEWGVMPVPVEKPAAAGKAKKNRHR